MNRNTLIQWIRERQSFLCIGLDPDLSKMPSGLSILQFNKEIIDATRDLCVAYKPNLAFYESLGKSGWDILGETLNYIGDEHFTIADAKRGDIGNTSSFYAKTFFETFPFDSITVAPYMGSDSVKPFMDHTGKWVILLALTSNSGADDFELQLLHNGQRLFEQVIQTSKDWGSAENMMYVVGATRPDLLLAVRKIIPDHFLLVPGVGAQGGDLKEVCKYGMNRDCGLLVNASRSIIYVSSGNDFAEKAREEAQRLQREMSELLPF